MPTSCAALQFASESSMKSVSSGNKLASCNTFSKMPDPASKVVGTGAYFGLMLLFAIPIIGQIACLIMAFAPKNKNIKHFARAQLIWMVIGIIIAALVIGGIVLLVNTFSDYIAEATGGEFNGLGDLFEQFQNGGFEDMPSNYPTE